MNLIAQCKRWQKLLRLEDWDIELHIMDDDKYEDKEAELEFKRDTTQGLSEIYCDRKLARIYIRKSSDNQVDTLVHEIAHIFCRPIIDVINNYLPHLASIDLQHQFAKDAADSLEVIVHPITRAFLHIYNKEHRE